MQNSQILTPHVYLSGMRRLIIIFCVAGSFYASAQNEGSVAGKLVDNESGEAVPFATIRIKNSMLGVVSNSNGDFQLPARITGKGDTLLISCIGYVTRSISTDALLEGINVIRVTQAVTQLEPVTISAKESRRKERQGLSAYRIVRTAIHNMKINYPQEPYSYIAYYRDYQLRRGQYINLNEAIVEVNDGGFQTDDQTASMIKLIQYKENTDFVRDSATTVPYDNRPAKFYKDKNKYIPNAVLSPMGGNELSILRLHDAIRNSKVISYSYVNVFSQNFTENHSFKLEKPVLHDTLALHCISFESSYAASGARNFAVGKIYIGVKDFAIHKLEYQGFNKTMSEVQLMYEIIVEYARAGSSMYLNYISFNNFFKTHNEREFKVIDITFDRPRSAFLLKFNSEPDPKSALDTANYDFRIGAEPIRIEMIKIVDKTNALVFVDEKIGNTLDIILANSPSRLKFGIKNVRDVDNRELDKVVSTTLYQFRELFVQKLNIHPLPGPLTGLVDKSKPLGLNSMSGTSDGSQGYWMNTPLQEAGKSTRK
jgi:hypothetical protein